MLGGVFTSIDAGTDTSSAEDPSEFFSMIFGGDAFVDLYVARRALSISLF